MVQSATASAPSARLPAATLVVKGAHSVNAGEDEPKEHQNHDEGDRDDCVPPSRRYVILELQVWVDSYLRVPPALSGRVHQSRR